jgi:hypothetical protein
MLAPALFTGTGALDWVNVAGRSDIAFVPPGPGDVLGAMRGRNVSDADLGATGKLPMTDELSAMLLADITNDSALGDSLNPFNDLPEGPLGIPGVMLQAYMNAEAKLAETKPGCRMTWSLLASIGRIESGHARGGSVDANGNATPRILGPVLNGGPGMAAIRDTDGGAFDGDTVWDRAVGPMQFIPSTWAGFAADGNGDGQSNPNNIYDATIGSGSYLCSGGGNMDDPTQRAQAIFRYNHSDEYVATVMHWATAYAAGVTPLPSLQGGDQDFFVPPSNDSSTGSPTNPTPPSSSSSNPPSSSSSNSSTPGTTPKPGTSTTITLPPGSSNPSTPPTCPSTPSSSPSSSTSSSTPSSSSSSSSSSPSVPPSCTKPSSAASSSPAASSSAAANTAPATVGNPSSPQLSN